MGGTHVLGDGAFRHVKPANRFVEAKDGGLDVVEGSYGLGVGVDGRSC
jgi:hypothetical protein